MTRKHVTSTAVKITAAQALGQYGSDSDARQALKVLLAHASPVKNGFYQGMMALNAIEAMPVKRITSAADAVKQLPAEDPKIKGRPQGYCKNLIQKILGDIEAANK